MDYTIQNFHIYIHFHKGIYTNCAPEWYYTIILHHGTIPWYYTLVLHHGTKPYQIPNKERSSFIKYKNRIKWG